MAKRTAFVVLWLAAVTSLCLAWGEEAMGKANSAAKEKIGSWSDWASNKFSEYVFFPIKKIYILFSYSVFKSINLENLEKI